MKLLKRISELEAHILVLITENRRLREALGLPIEEIVKHTISEEKENNEVPIIVPIINKYSSPEEKIELFMSLFRGRTDVYAKRYYSKKHESIYYIPACKNEWVRGIYDRVRTKCKDCTHRELLPLTKEVIDSHLRNKDENGAGIVGIYPLLPDETCLFLAISMSVRYEIQFSSYDRMFPNLSSIFLWRMNNYPVFAK